MRADFARTTASLLLAIYAAAIVPGHGWHLVPGCGHRFCHEEACDSHLQSSCAHQHEHNERPGAGHTGDPSATGFGDGSDVAWTDAACAICQLIATAQLKDASQNLVRWTPHWGERSPADQPRVDSQGQLPYHSRAPPA